jgi:hypothetical protein
MNGGLQVRDIAAAGAGLGEPRHRCEHPRRGLFIACGVDAASIAMPTHVKFCRLADRRNEMGGIEFLVRFSVRRMH